MLDALRLLASQRAAAAAVAGRSLVDRGTAIGTGTIIVVDLLVSAVVVLGVVRRTKLFVQCPQQHPLVMFSLSWLSALVDEFSFDLSQRWLSFELSKSIFGSSWASCRTVRVGQAPVDVLLPEHELVVASAESEGGELDVWIPSQIVLPLLEHVVVGTLELAAAVLIKFATDGFMFAGKAVVCVDSSWLVSFVFVFIFILVLDLRPKYLSNI